MKQLPLSIRVHKNALLATVLVLQGCATIMGPNLDKGQKAFSEGRDADAIYNLRPFANSGGPRVKNALGRSLYRSAETDQDYRDAMRFLKLAYAGGYLENSELIGQMYLRGKGVAKDELAAAKWFDLFQQSGGHPDWSLLPGPPKKGYAEARFNYLNRLRLQQDTWMSLNDIFFMYGISYECCEPFSFRSHEMPAQRMASYFWYHEDDANAKDGDEAFFDENGRKIRMDTIHAGRLDFTNFWDYDPQTHTATQYYNARDPSNKTHYYTDGLNKFIDQWFDPEEIDTHTYNKSGDVYIQTEQYETKGKTGKIDDETRFNAATGEKIYKKTVDKAGVTVREMHCTYQADYSRQCIDKENGKTIKTIKLSASGWLMEQTDYDYCINGVIKQIHRYENVYKNVDAEGNWWRRELIHKASVDNEACVVGMLRIEPLPAAWEVRGTRVDLREIKYPSDEK